MRERIVTAAVGIPIVALALFLTNSPLIIFLVAIVIIASLVELVRLLGGGALDWALIAIGALLCFAALVAALSVEVPHFTLIFFLVWVLGIAGCHWAHDSAPARLLMPGYIIAPLALILVTYLYDAKEPTTWTFDRPILLAILPLWAGDSAAYFVGRAFGKHPLAPSISPKKTWEGAIANFIACVLTAVGIAFLTGMNLRFGLGAGIICGVLGQVGDLFQSALKRRAGLKDSGSLLPGHGGILDRIDSLLFTIIPVLLIAVAMYRRG